MNHTTNLNLPQWEKTDRIMMDDFNDAFSKLDTAVKANSTAIASKADTSALTAETQARTQALAAETQAREAGDLWVKLGEATLTSADTSLELSIPSPASYRKLLLEFRSSGTSGIKISCNDNVQGYETNNTSAAATAFAVSGAFSDDNIWAEVELHRCGKDALVCGKSRSIGNEKQSTTVRAMENNFILYSLAFDDLTKVTFSASRNMDAGTCVVLYGFK